MLPTQPVYDADRNVLLRHDLVKLPGSAGKIRSVVGISECCGEDIIHVGNPTNNAPCEPWSEIASWVKKVKQP